MSVTAFLVSMENMIVTDLLQNVLIALAVIAVLSCATAGIVTEAW